ncbi:hypothetical protein [Spirosoma sp.]|uniref:hypothetical protein n=1 Tax=Spirosoma sp. TaxID=1899569 RepID=UPI003B3ABE0C
MSDQSFNGVLSGVTSDTFAGFPQHGGEVVVPKEVHDRLFNSDTPTVEATIKSTPTGIQSDAFQIVQDFDRMLSKHRAFHQDLIFKNAFGQLTPQEQAYYDAWTARLIAESESEAAEDEEE